MLVSTLRKRILEVAYRDGMGHIPSALSILDIVWNLYDKVMTPDDQFILSKGHGVMALYAVLEAKGLLDWSKPLMGHPKRGGAILASTGSLGHGLPMAVGLAKAKKIKGEKGRVFCLIGDGECNEGTTWESALLAAHHKLSNLVVIVDQNHSSDRALDMGNFRADNSLSDKFFSFGFAYTISPGHNHFMLEENITWCPKTKKPLAVIAETVKGQGIPFMQNDPSWHNRKISSEQEYKEILKDLYEDKYKYDR
jgi:transketolase